MPRFLKILCFCLFCLSLPALAADKENTSEFAGVFEKKEEAIVPFKLHHGHMIVVKCSVGGVRDLTAIIDTGASETVLDTALARKLRLNIEPDSATFLGQPARVWAVSIPSLELGPIHADRLPGIAADLSSLTAELGIRPQVVIGMDVLHRSSLVIDYQSRRLVFGAFSQMFPEAGTRSGKPAHSAALLWGDSSRRFAMIEASVAGKAVRLHVDSGFEGLLLFGGPPRGATIAQESHVANLGQNLLAHTLMAPDVRIGDWHASHAQVTIVDRPPPESAEFDGLIGTALLSRKTVAFDFERGMICWE